MVQNLTGNELVSYGKSAGCIQAGSVSLGLTNCYDYYHHYYPVYYPSYHIHESKSKIEQSFRIVGKLLENKFIEKDLTVKEFMKLVDQISDIL